MSKKMKGEASYQGYNFYQKYIQEQYNNPAVIVEQKNVTNFVRFGIDYGPASIWSFTPPTGSMKRVIRYEITFQYQTNILLAYSLDGSEQLEIGASFFLCLFSCFVSCFVFFVCFLCLFLAMFVSCFCFLI